MTLCFPEGVSLGLVQGGEAIGCSQQVPVTGQHHCGASPWGGRAAKAGKVEHQYSQ